MELNKEKIKKSGINPRLAGVLTALFFLCLGFFILWQRYHILVKAEEREMSTIVNIVKQDIDQSLKNSYSAALSLALLINDDGEIGNFEAVAPKILEGNPNIDGLQLVPGGVIRKVYPYQENKEALDYNILQDPSRNKEALRAIKMRKMYFAGPFELRQGGMAVVGRLPVFIRDEFWGFSAVIIKMDHLIHLDRIEDMVKDKYYYQFSKVDITTGEEFNYFPKFSKGNTSYSEVVELPDGDWKFYLATQDQSYLLLSLIPLALLIILLSFWFGWSMTSILKQPLKLQALVKAQAGKLLESELNFRTIFNQAAIGMVRVDTLTGKFIQSNKRYIELLGYTEEELMAMDYKDISYPEDVGINSIRMRQLLNGEIREYSLQKRLVRKDGSLLWIKVTVSPLWQKGEQPTSHIALIEDISDKMQAQEELIHNEKRFRALVENSEEVICIFTQKGQTFYFSPAIERVSGYTESEIRELNLISLMHPDDLDYINAQMEISINTPMVPVSGIACRARHKDGTWKWIEITITNLLEDPAIGGFVANFKDITLRKEVEINLNKSYQLVMDQNRRFLNFSYIVSHNLRSHSSNIEAILTLYHSADSAEEKVTYIELLSKVSTALNQTLMDLNEVVSIQNNIDLSVEPLSVLSYVNQTLDLLEVQVKNKEAVIKKDIPKEMVVVFNSAYLESVLLNFLSNALRYSSSKRIPEISLKGYKLEDKWILEIMDNGVGIDLKRYGDKLFGLYKTFTNKSGSRGVGLFITKNQIDAMGGQVNVESELGIGTTFKISFK
ncbi:PAS domain S-box protein [Gillisia sp. M10.2A]|uniref:histidine kinase n=1 Tax=Gillisia lutea TaxID=2909668 RepID=A0ABS9EHC0_9FLAO|nr:PAS domain S-box protein [Gillisia lutea]MCF4100848.1 PAS domain S-box protein [Gillisia lutea]